MLGLCGGAQSEAWVFVLLRLVLNGLGTMEKSLWASGFNVTLYDGHSENVDIQKEKSVGLLGLVMKSGTLHAYANSSMIVAV